MDRKNNNRKRSHLLIPELIKSLIFFLSLEYKYIYIENSEFYYFLLYFLFINILLLKIQKKSKEN